MKEKESVDTLESKQRKKSRTEPASAPASLPKASDKMSPTSKNISQDNLPKTMPVKTEGLDKMVFRWEEEEAERRGSANDLSEFMKTCSDIRQAVGGINKMKSMKDFRQNADVVQERVKTTILMTNMRRLNRLAQIRGKSAIEDTQEVKQKVDGLHIQLQNLLYEVMHMKKEIEQCVNFTSKDEDIELVSVDEFYKNAPPEVCKPDITKVDTHQQMLARLDWEMQQRKGLCAQKEEFARKKVAMEEEIKRKSEHLLSLKPRLHSIMTATLPVQEFMGMPIEAERLQFESAQYLSRPLYVLYIQAMAYRDAFDRKMKVEIEGDLQEAKSVLDEQVELEESEESENEGEQTEEGDKEDKKRRKHTKEKEKARLEDHRRSLIRRHPLHVAVGIKCKDSNEVNLKFYHLPSIHICTVEIDLKICDSSQQTPILASSSLMSPAMILRDLMCGDPGLESPNPANKYQLERLRMGVFSDYIGQVGHPYYWVQWICGLHYLPNDPIAAYEANPLVSYNHMQRVVKAIKARISARLALQSQLAQLENLVIPPPSRKSVPNCFPSKTVCQLTSWKSITFEDFRVFPFAEGSLEMQMADESCAFYQARFTREESLDVVMVVYDSYPSNPPLLLVGSVDKSSKFADDTLRCLECEVSAYADELLKLDHPNMVLSTQLRKLQVSFDMLVETGNQSLAKEKLYTRRVRGRDRNRPYRFHQDGYFTHR